MQERLFQLEVLAGNGVEERKCWSVRRRLSSLKQGSKHGVIKKEVLVRRIHAFFVEFNISEFVLSLVTCMSLAKI